MPNEMRDRLIEIVKNSLIKYIDKSCNLAENIVDDLLSENVTFPPVAFSDNRRERMIELICESTQTEECIAHCNHPPCRQCANTADYLLSNGVILPQCRIGDKVYFILDDEIVDEGEDPICELTVTEVGSRGFWVSGSDPAEDDMSDFTPWEDLGKTAFFSRSDAEKEYRKKCQ